MNIPQLAPRALAGLRVVEMGQLIAGPFAGKTLADFGADVIKVEPPGLGDPLRNWRLIQDGTSVWWQVQSRNKRSIALDLRSQEGQGIARKLIAGADVLIETFRPGTLEGWNMSYEELSRENPGLVMLRISGYGQTGPYRDLPGFGAIGEAMGGLRHLTGEPGRVPVRCGVSIGDTLAALHGTIGVLTALYHRKVNGGKGQVVDVALTEAVFNVMESVVPEYSAFGVAREPAGSALPGIAPSNAYRCTDGIVPASRGWPTTLVVWPACRSSISPSRDGLRSAVWPMFCKHLAMPRCPPAACTPPKTSSRTHTSARAT